MAMKLATHLFLVALALGGFTGNSSAGETPGMELSQALNQAKLFAGLTPQERVALETAASLRHCEKGERIIEQGKHSSRMFILLGGQAEVKVNGKAVATVPPQTLVGEIEFLDKQPGSADVILLQDADVIELNNSELAGLMQAQHHLGYVLMSEIAKIEAQRLRAMDEK